MNNIEKSWKTITLIPDYMNAVLELRDCRDILESIVKVCELQTEFDKAELFFALFGYTVKAYKNHITLEQVKENTDAIKTYLNSIIETYNEITQSSYSKLHVDIWYNCMLREIMADSDMIQPIEEITSNEEFERCEIKHKNLMLGLHIQILLNSENIDLEKINSLNSRLKLSNAKVMQMNSEF